MYNTGYNASTSEHTAPECLEPSYSTTSIVTHRTEDNPVLNSTHSRNFCINSSLTQDQSARPNTTWVPSALRPQHSTAPQLPSTSSVAETGQQSLISSFEVLPPVILSQDPAPNSRKKLDSYSSAGVDVQATSQVSKAVRSSQLDGHSPQGALNILLLNSINKAAGGASNLLIQVWLPVATEDGRLVLSTFRNPHLIQGVDENLSLFRQISTKYRFNTASVDQGGAKTLGMPGRVFNSCRAEVSPDVRLYTRDEYLRADEARRMGVGATIVLPVLSRTQDKILAAVECVSTSANFSVSACMQQLCHSLEDVGLTSQPSPLRLRSPQALDRVAQVAAHMQQPLARVCAGVQADCGSLVVQAWVPSHFPGKDSSLSEGPVHLVCSPNLTPTTVNRPEVELFRHMAAQIKLGPKEGPVGWAYTLGRMVAARDIRQYAAFDYPLVSFVRTLGLQMCVAVQVTMGELVCVLEMFPQATHGRSQEETVGQVLSSVCAHCSEAGLAPLVGTPGWFNGTSVWNPLAPQSPALLGQGETGEYNLQPCELSRSCRPPPVGAGAVGGAIGGIGPPDRDLDIRRPTAGSLPVGQSLPASSAAVGEGGGIPSEAGNPQQHLLAQLMTMQQEARDTLASMSSDPSFGNRPDPSQDQWAVGRHEARGSQDREPFVVTPPLEGCAAADPLAGLRSGVRQEMDPLVGPFPHRHPGLANGDMSESTEAASESTAATRHPMGSSHPMGSMGDESQEGEGELQGLRVGGMGKKEVPLEVLEQHFHWRLRDVADKLGICVSTFKRICRDHGIQRWPCRKLTAEMRAEEEKREKKARAEARRRQRLDITAAW